MQNFGFRFLRGLVSAFTNELVAKKQKPDGELGDDDALAVIKREANKRKDSIEQFTKGNRPELAEKEKKELEIFDAYLPEMMGIDEVRKVVEAKKDALGASGPADKGKLMGTLMKELHGKADGKMVKDIVDELLQ